MRLPASLFCAALLFPAASARAEDFFVRSPVTVSLTASRTGPEEVKITAGGAREVFRAERQRFRISNKDVLELLAAEEFGLIPSARGWRLIGVWATWPETGNGYRLHVQNTAVPSDIREIPQGLLDLQILGGAVAIRHRLDADDHITGGTERYTMLAKLIVNDAASAGYVVGSLTGSGRYAHSKVAGATLYLPQSSQLTGAGVRDEADPDSPDFILEGGLSFGAAQVISTATSQTSSGSSSTSVSGSVWFDNVQINGTAIGLDTLHVGSTGTLHFNTTPLSYIGTVTFDPGATLILGGQTIVIGSAITLGGPDLAALDLTALPAGYTLADGVLTYTPPPSPASP
jgi:hypothetical protein